MKIRIKGNSVRFRLTKTEAEITHFHHNALTYALVAKEEITELEADFIDNTITIYFPKSEQKIWAKSDRVGYSNSVDWNDSSALSLLVEKDFTCMDNTVEDQSDNYPNPKMA